MDTPPRTFQVAPSELQSEERYEQQRCTSTSWPNFSSSQLPSHSCAEHQRMVHETRCRSPTDPEPLDRQDRSLVLNFRHCLEKYWSAKNPFLRVQITSNSCLKSPVNASTLQELEWRYVANNPKLRHDLNFEPEIWFRPYKDGEKGIEKDKTKSLFYAIAEADLDWYNFLLYDQEMSGYKGIQEWKSELGMTVNRMLNIFRDVKHILDRLLPPQIREELDGVVDLPLISQELQHGVFDVITFFKWLSVKLRFYCAPSRDHMAHAMLIDVEDGVKHANMSALVMGFRKLFSLLENMKLDVANFHVRYFRAPLLQCSTNFEQSYIKTRIDNGDVDLVKAIPWYGRSLHQPQDVSSWQLGATSPFSHFLSIILSTLIPLSYPGPWFPKTFNLDSVRLESIRSELYGLIYMAICHKAFMSLVRQRRLEDSTFQPKLTEHEFLTRIDIVMRPTQGPVDAQLCCNAQNVTAEVISCAAISCEEFRQSYEQHMISSLKPTSAQFLAERQRLWPILYNKILLLAQLHGSSDSNRLSESLARTRAKNRIDDLAQKISHVALIHWRVWAPSLLRLERRSTCLNSRPTITTIKAVDMDINLDIGVDSDVDSGVDMSTDLEMSRNGDEISPKDKNSDSIMCISSNGLKTSNGSETSNGSITSNGSETSNGSMTSNGSKTSNDEKHQPRTLHIAHQKSRFGNDEEDITSKSGIHRASFP